MISNQPPGLIVRGWSDSHTLHIAKTDNGLTFCGRSLGDIVLPGQVARRISQGVAAPGEITAEDKLCQKCSIGAEKHGCYPPYRRIEV